MAGFKTVYYQEGNGDYMMVIYGPDFNGPGDEVTARGAAIAGNALSVCTTSASRGYIREGCKAVRKADVPQKWMARF